MSSAPKPRPKYYDLSPAHLPTPGLVSIFHRVSGLLLFFPILPAMLYVLQGALGTEEVFGGLRDFHEQVVDLVGDGQQARNFEDFAHFFGGDEEGVGHGANGQEYGKWWEIGKTAGFKTWGSVQPERRLGR